MTLSLYMDHHVDAAITRGLRRLGIDVLTCFEDGTATWADELILDRATRLGRIVFTQDEDFLEIAGRWLQDGRSFAGVVFAHQEGLTVGQAVRDLQLIAFAADSAYMRDRIEYLPYR